MEDVTGRSVSLYVPVECLNQILMTLPGMVQQAVQRRFRDPTLRIVYLLQSSRFD
jgi:hypothetical protein